MGWVRGWLKQLRALLAKNAVERELDEETAFHVAMETEKNLREGMPPGEARRAALVAPRRVLADQRVLVFQCVPEDEEPGLWDKGDPVREAASSDSC